MPHHLQVIDAVSPTADYHQNRYARRLEGMVEQGCHWLDLGAGTRIHEGWLAAPEDEIAARAAILVGCDLAEDNLRQNPFIAAAVLADGVHLPFAEQSFDLVTANMVVEHLADPASVFREVARVLRPGGRFVFVTPNRANPVVFLASILLPKPVRRRLAQLVESRNEEDVFPTFYRANSSRSIRRELAGIKLRIARLERFSSFPIIKNFWPVTALECLLIRLADVQPLAWSRSNIYCELVKME